MRNKKHESRAPGAVLAALLLAACAPSFELPPGVEASAELRDLFRAGRIEEAMPRLMAEQLQRQQQLQREQQADQARERAEERNYVYRPPPALFHQSVLITLYDPLGTAEHEAVGTDDPDDQVDPVRRAPGAGSARQRVRDNAASHRARFERSLHEQREIRRAVGDPRAELAAFQRILATREAALGPTHRDVIIAMSNVGAAQAEADEPAAARETLERAVALAERVHGPRHPGVAIVLDRLAALHVRQGVPAAADPLYDRALAIRTAAARPLARDVAATLNNQGAVAARLGDIDRARSHYLRAIGLYETAIRDADRDAEQLWQRLTLRQQIVVVHANTGLLAWQHGDIGQAIEAFRRARTTHNAMRWLGFDSMSEAQQFAMIDGFKEEIETLMALDHGYARGLGEAAQLALGGILEHKGRALESLASTMAASVRSAPAAARTPRARIAGIELPLVPGANSDPHARQRMRAELEAVRAQLANLSLFPDHDAQALARRAEIERLAQRERQLVGALGDHIAAEQQATQLNALIEPIVAQAMRETSRDATAGPLRAYEEQLMANALEMIPGYAQSRLAVSIVPAVQRAIPDDAVLVEIATYRRLDPKATDAGRHWGPRRYAAYVLRNSGDPRSVDLGEADAIDRLVAQLRHALADPRRDSIKAASRALDAQVMAPIRVLLGEARHVLLAPDAALHLVPFGALLDEQGRYLIERYTFTYLTTGRDLLRMATRQPARQPPLIVADPEFGTRPVPEAQADSPNATPRSVDFRHVQFESLPGTAREAAAIQRLYSDAVLLAGASATEAAIKRVQGPRILHVATHGFFLPDQPIERIGTAPRSRENPLLRSGLVLAGANRGARSADDGVLTALELAGLDLVGTQLVTLSACETGLGEVLPGEGVFGLRRALVIAGAESQVISLWKVDDETTESLMVDFYQRLRADAGRSEALRQAQLRMLADPNLAHPFFWAGFILSGDWRALQR